MSRIKQLATEIRNHPRSPYDGEDSPGHVVQEVLREKLSGLKSQEAEAEEAREELRDKILN